MAHAVETDKTLNPIPIRSLRAQAVVLKPHDIADAIDQAPVVEFLPSIHDTVRYDYRVDGRGFQGQMQSWRPNPPLPQLAVGHALVIYYDPQHPEDSVLGYPKPMLQTETISVALAAVI